MKEKVCSKCNSSFRCHNPEPGCWCENVHLTNDTLTQLKETYDDCLCPECLKSYEQAEPAYKIQH